MARVSTIWWTRWRHPAPVVVDAATAALVAVLEFAVIPHQRWPQAWWSVLALSAAFALPVTFRRVSPWLAVGLTMAAFAVSASTRYSGTGLVLSYMMVTYSVAAYLPTRRAVLAAGLLWTPLLTTVAIPPELNPDGVPVAYLMLTTGATCAASFFVGRSVHNRRAYTASLEARARAAEENQQILAQQAVADERRRIARELHDVVAHHVSVMGVLATGARRVLPRQPASADEALRTIEQTGRATLREMRALLSVLRTDAEHEEAQLAPQPGLAGIDTVVEQVREAGLPVTLQVSGETARLDSGVALTIHRIVQEALTNTLKHAGEAAAAVRLEIGPEWLELEVFDTGRGPAGGLRHVGHGLLGMRERVALYGGILHTGPRLGGGFRVYARIPMEQPDAVPVQPAGARGAG
ncbi:MAG TPA: sensor histidine kinase [Micromonosporaceae bacterium]|jgi:signal transduction histidine kinase